MKLAMKLDDRVSCRLLSAMVAILESMGRNCGGCKVRQKYSSGEVLEGDA
jgi:hypothetical protein